MDAPATGSRRSSIDPTSALLLFGHAIVWLAVLVLHPAAAMAEDVARFIQVAAAPGTPYRDVPVEYMPLETALIRFMFNAPPGQAAVRVVVVAAICDVVAFVMIRGLYGVAAGRWYLAIALPLQIFMIFRLDMVSVVLVLLALRLARSGRRGWAGAAFAAAVLFKIWPIVLVPVLLQRAGRRGAISAAAVAAVGVVAWLVVGGVDAVGQVSGFRGATGWHIESTVGAVVSLLGAEAPRFELGTMRVGTITDAAVWAVRIATVCLLVAVWWRARTRPDAAPEGMPSAAAVAALIAFAPVASAQYLAWIVPWAAVAAAERSRPLATGAALAAGVLAASSFLIYWGVAGGVGELEVISALRAACVLTIPIAWLAERPVDA